jgi:hypothetical protein
LSDVRPNRFHITLFLLLLASSVAFGEPKQINVLPTQIDLLGAGDEHGLLVTAVEADGRILDVTRQARLSSGDAKIVAIAPDGALRAAGNGSATVRVEFEGKDAQVNVTVSGIGEPHKPSFRQEIVPVLTKAGCNAGACHGKLAGQAGFKLSLRGYAPEADYPSLTDDLSSRRINYAAPAQSLMILKPAGLVPHEGGKRFEVNSRPYRTLVEWISNRATKPDPAELDSAALEVLPGGHSMRVGDEQQLLVRARWADGRVKDVTWLCQFVSNDEATLSVTAGGLVKALRNGEAPIRVHFQGQVAVITFTMPYAQTVDPSLVAQKNNFIDQHVFDCLLALHLPPSPLCDDATFIRRASLDVTGTLPSPKEITAFVASNDPNKRSKMIDSLLAKPEFVDFWTLQLCDLLQNRKERDHDVRGAKGVRAFHAWVHDQVAANRPWNELAHEVLTASGDAVSHPEIGYYVYNVGEKKAAESEVVDSVAQAFLGTRVGCARCHNHPLEKFTQDDYYHFAAFFSRVSMKRQDMAKGIPTVLSLAVPDEVNNLRKQIEQIEKAIGEGERAGKKVDGEKKRLADVKSQLEKALAKPPGVNQPRTGKMMVAQPLDRSPIDFAPGDDPRAQLADWITNPSNPAFAGAMVNRIWSHYLGVGLVEPVDDLRSSNPPTNLALWKALNEEFVANHYDLRHLMRVILNSRTYQLSSATSAANETDRKFYSHYYARRLPAEVLLDAISSATGVPDSFSGYPVGIRAIDLPDPSVNSYFLTLFGRSERVTACVCERNGDISLPQLLHLENGADVQRKITAGEGRLSELLKNKDDEAAMDELFLSTVSHVPSDAERSAARQALEGGDPRAEVYRDLFWALLNSKEFAFNH